MPGEGVGVEVPGEGVGVEVPGEGVGVVVPGEGCCMIIIIIINTISLLQFRRPMKLRSVNTEWESVTLLVHAM